MKVLIDIKQVDNTAIVEDTKSTNQQHICIVHQSSSTSTFFAHNQSHFSAVFMNELTLVVSTNHTTKPYAILSCNVQFCLIQYNSIKSFIFSILQYPTLSSNRQAPLVSRCLGFSSSDKFLPKTVWKHTLTNLNKPTRVHTNRQKLSRRTYTNIQDEGPHGSRQLQAKGNGHSLHCYATKTPQIAFTFSLGQPFSFNIS